ncbi:MAG: hypothetical protein KDD62_12005 [Bdellovibrionales bacterium]|nr:hypothetical protein [Bdellovibrionales bacterium]
MKRLRNEFGETQIGLILGALAIGCLSWVTFTLQGCIKETVEARGTKFQEQDRAARKPPKFQKQSRSYKVRY